MAWNDRSWLSEENPDPPKGTPNSDAMLSTTLPLDTDAVTGGRSSASVASQRLAADYRRELDRHLHGRPGTGSLPAVGMQEHINTPKNPPRDSAPPH
jgi:hypothetical protein